MNRTPLMRLTNQGLAAVDASFLCGTPECLADDPSFTTPIVGHEGADFSSLNLDLPGGSLSPTHDPIIAMALHTQLGIRRGVATDPRMWAWIATRHTPMLLRRRWSTGNRPPNRNRFVGRLVDNGLARLWWAAELTREPGTTSDVHHAAATALLSSQYRTDRLLSMAILRHPPVLLGVLDAIGGDIRWQVLNQVCRRLGLMATTYAIYAMSRADTRALVRELYETVLADGEFSSEGEPGG